ncbi:MAG: hypothetical protein QOF62_1510 [Pyrinomonadaceae bacterium]|jgi:hypothetical protein|nr:hypothetical protein [Pyrinomonadaceae bacterium]
MNPHVIQQVLLVAPVFFDFDEQLEVTAMSDQAFNVSARLYADFFQARRAFADHDLFLCSALDKDRAGIPACPF